jgi:hypothetical protein
MRRTLAALPTLMVLGGAAFLLWWHRPVEIPPDTSKTGRTPPDPCPESP